MKIQSFLKTYVTVEPFSISPTWVHFDRRQKPPACTSGGYPLIKRGSLSVYVLIAQDDLNTLGYSTGSLDGIFGTQTYNAVRNYQKCRLKRRKNSPHFIIFLIPNLYLFLLVQFALQD